MPNFLGVLFSYPLHLRINILFDILTCAVLKYSCFHLLIVTIIFTLFRFKVNGTLLGTPQLLCTRTQKVVPQMFQETKHSFFFQFVTTVSTSDT